MQTVSRREFLRTAGVGAAAVGLGTAARLAWAAERRERLNVLFIAVDDLRPANPCEARAV